MKVSIAVGHRKNQRVRFIKLANMVQQVNHGTYKNNAIPFSDMTVQHAV